ncbi:MAG TPA: hypothetical protein PKN64_07300, partial [Casimicrobium sp.]|nr:hypothetical protein [Casimicrobium sp.]
CASVPWAMRLPSRKAMYWVDWGADCMRSVAELFARPNITRIKIGCQFHPGKFVSKSHWAAMVFRYPLACFVFTIVP